MSKRTKDFQIYFVDYKEWENKLKKSKSEASILVVDVHSTWCGPCKAIVPSFQKLFLEHSDEYNIKFCVVDSEKVLSSLAASGDSEKNEEGDLNDDSRRDRYTELLKQAAGKSQPHFLFYSNGKFKRKITGINTPLIIKSIYQRIEDTGVNENESMMISGGEYDEKNETAEERDAPIEGTIAEMNQEEKDRSNEDTLANIEENSSNSENQENVNKDGPSSDVEITGDSESGTDEMAQSTDTTAGDDGDSPDASIEDAKEIQATEEKEIGSNTIESIPETDAEQNQVKNEIDEDTEEKEVENSPDDSAEEIQTMGEEATIATEGAVSTETEEHSPTAESIQQDPADEGDEKQVENPSQDEEMPSTDE